jgi:anti-sigma factor RsiW
MKHLKDDQLRAFWDKEVSGEQAAKAQEHLSACPACQNRLEQITARAWIVRERMDALAPGPLEQPRSTQAAYTRFAHNSQLMKEQKELKQTMSTRRPLWTALAILAVLVLVFTLTPASAWASDFLGLFRVQRIQVVAFDRNAAENAVTRLESSEEAIRQIFRDDLQVKERSETVDVASVDEASAKAGFTPRLPDAVTGLELQVKGGMNAIFTIDQPKLQELLDMTDVGIRLPEDINGKTITANIPEAIVASSGCDIAEGEKGLPGDCIALVQMPSPTVDAPENLDMPAMGAAVFEFLGLSADEARELSQRIDWTSTLVLPIPQGDEVQYEDVRVDGVSGTLFLETGQNSYDLIWIKDGILYGLHGPGGKNEAIKLASSLK